MIRNHDRLIIIAGMAHSGTTILAHILRQHPNIFLYTDGSESRILENTILPLKDEERLETLLQTIEKKRILLKRPWCEIHHGEWFIKEFPNTKFLYCLRTFDEISKSWSKPTSIAGAHLMRDTKQYQLSYYKYCLNKAILLGASLPYFTIVNHAKLIENPKQTILAIANWLKLGNWDWNVEDVSDIENIKDKLVGSEEPNLGDWLTLKNWNWDIIKTSKNKTNKSLDWPDVENWCPSVNDEFIGSGQAVFELDIKYKKRRII